MKYKAGYKYQLHKDEVIEIPIYQDHLIESDFIELTSKGVLTVKKGYAWDGASSVAWDTKNIMTPSLAHDALYQLMRERKLPHSFWKRCDYIFEMLCLNRDMWKVRAAWLRKGLSFAHGGAALPSHKKKILTVP